MPHFKCKARNAEGKLVLSIIEAETQFKAAQILNSRGLTPINISVNSSSNDLLEKFNKWQALNSLELTDLMLFSRQMYSLTKAGVPIVRSIRSLVESTRNIALVDALKDIAKRLESGSALSPALLYHQNIFSNLFISIINVGENSGGLETAFLQISKYLEQEKDTQSRIKSALRYPTMVLIAISIAIIVINIYVIPAFRHVFDSMHAELPWQTTLLINISDFTVNYWYYLLAIIIAIFAIFKKAIATPEGRIVWDKFLLRMPAIGSIVERATMERFCRSFAMTLSAGVPLIQGLNLVIDAIDNRYVSSKLEQMRLGIEKGDTISRMARNTQLFPTLVIQMIMVGEETGNISEMLLEVADFYKTEVDTDLKNIASAIEPILICIIGGMVLILALGIFLPMWNLSSAMH